MSSGLVLQATHAAGWHTLWRLPCTPPPWGTLNAVDLATGGIGWKVPLGTIGDLAPVPLVLNYGVPNLGGPIVTASGLVFIEAAMDDYQRASHDVAGDGFESLGIAGIKK